MQFYPIDDALDLASLPSSDRELVERVVSATLELYESNGAVPPWIGYLAEEDGQVVGTCGFKGPPQNGRVELAYFTFPKNEAHGVATRMGRELLQIAHKEDRCISVFAQTLPDRNASHRVLEKLGFAADGIVHHASDGDILEWSLVEL